MEKITSSEAERLFPEISSSSPIPELLQLLKHSFKESEFDEVERILLDRENSMKKEIDSLKRWWAVSDLVNIGLEDDLATSRREVEELRRKKLKTDRTVEELNGKISEADQTGETHTKKRFEYLTARVEKVEQILANVYKIDVKDLLNLANDIDKTSNATEKDAINIPSSDGNNDSSGNGSRWSGENADSGKRDLEHFRNERSPMNGVDVGKTSPVVRVHSACNSDGSGTNSLPATGCENLVLSSQAKEAGANGNNMAQSSPGVQSAHAESQPATNVALDDEVPATDHLEFGGSSSKMMPSLESGDIIEISDSDDEAIPLNSSFTQTDKQNRADYQGLLASSTPNGKRTASQHDKDERFSIGVQQEKRTQEVINDGPGSLITKGLLSMHNHVPIRRCDAKAEVKIDSQNPSHTCYVFDVSDSTDSEDESLSDAHMDHLVANLQNKQICKTWMFGADMLKAFEEDPELCLNAVCALYRQQLSAAKSTNGSTLSPIGGLRPCDVMSIHDLAEYLIDGDPQHRLRKSVSEVEHQSPDVLRHCQNLATNYYNRLFEIYHKGEDPFFGPR